MTREEMIKRFVEEWKCPVDTARYYLERHNWNCDAAADEFWRNHILIY